MAKKAANRGNKAATTRRQKRAIGRLRAAHTQASQEGEEEKAKEESILGLNPKESGKKIVYSGFKLAGDLYEPNDCVLIKQEDPSGAPYVAEILGVYQYLDSDNIRLVVRWYHRAHDIEIKRSELPQLVEDEIFASNYIQDDIDVETVDGPCIVYCGQEQVEKKLKQRQVATATTSTKAKRGKSSTTTSSAKRPKKGARDEDTFTKAKEPQALSETLGGIDSSDSADEGDGDDDDAGIEELYCRWFYDIYKRKLMRYEDRPSKAMEVEARRLVLADTAAAKRWRNKKLTVAELATDLGGEGEHEEDDEEDDDHEVSGVEDDEERDSDEDSTGSKATRESKREKKGAGKKSKAQNAKEKWKNAAARRLKESETAGQKGSRGRVRGRGRAAPILRVPETEGSELVEDQLDAMQRVKQQLQLSAVGKTTEALPCRELEFYEIMAFIQSKVETGSSGCMFVSGVPGTGKTASIRAVARELQSQLTSGTMPFFTFVEINGMALTTPKQAYVELWHALSENKESNVTAAQALEMLNHRFTKPSPRRRTAVVLLDEVDQLYTKKQDVLYNMFDWPTHDRSHLILVAVANTMDLPERVFHQRVASRLGLTRLTFMPYTHQQLVQILEHRLDEFDCFLPDAIQLCSRKVSAVSGDARRALSICQRAAEIARNDRLSEHSDNSAGIQVTIHHVSSAIKEMSSSPLLQAIEHASLQEKLFVLATIATFRQTGVEEAVLEQVSASHRSLCLKLGYPVPSSSVLTMVCSNLASTRVILAESASLDLRRKVRLNCSTEDALFALRDEPGAQQLARHDADSS
eukprot:m.136928 g.136928  ORF g.136928 m.136928 type:complete len:807 (-) comp15879_c0_seq1:157-2577(-)